MSQMCIKQIRPAHTNSTHKSAHVALLLHCQIAELLCNTSPHSSCPGRLKAEGKNCNVFFPWEDYFSLAAMHTHPLTLPSTFEWRQDWPTSLHCQPITGHVFSHTNTFTIILQLKNALKQLLSPMTRIIISCYLVILFASH